MAGDSEQWSPMAKWIAGMVAVCVPLLLLGIYLGNRGGGSSGASDVYDPETGVVGDGGAVTDDGSVPDASSGGGESYEFDGHGANVDRGMFGKAWPLTVREGRVNCVVEVSGHVSVVFTSDDNKRYALNGIAKAQSDVFGYLPLERIWAPDPATGAKKDISVLIDICAPLMK